ncbi:MAG: cadherin domain-containing protein [Nitrospira sp.]
MWVFILDGLGIPMFGFGRKKKPSASNTQKEQQVPAPSSGVKNSLLSLEQRLMFDAAAAATASEVASEQVAQEQAEAAVSSDNHADGPSAEQTESQGVLDAIATYNPGESRSEVVFVDPTVPNYQDLLSGMDPNVEVIMLDGGQDGVEQMANALSGRTSIDAIHVISHGGAGELQLGTGMLNADSMSTQYADDLAVIQQSLSEQADILVYGCEFAQGEAGQAAVDMLAELTGADVQASDDLTGSISLGGDWEFEVSTGTIETSLAVGYDAQMNWAEVLGTETVKDTFSTESYSNNTGTQSWSSSWSETDAGGGGAGGGDVRVNSGQLRIDTDRVGNAISRGVDLSRATSATLTFSYANSLSGADRVELRVSTDGGTTYRTVSSGIFSNSANTGSGTASIDLSGYMSANTKIQFVVTGTGGGDRLYVDNVQVSYETGPTNTAPTISNLSGDSLSYTEGAGALVIDQGANALVADSDSANFDTGTLTVSIPVGNEPTEDVLSVRNQGTGAGQIGVSGNTVTYGGVAIGTFSGGAGGNNLVISFNNNATSTAVTALVKNITYEDIDTDSPAEGSFTIRFALTDGDGGTSANHDVSAYISGINDAPTDLSLSANTVAENATNGTVVGTVSGTDPDAYDTKTYSLTDNAGGRFSINGSTGVLTVANGSLLNYEAATSHSITVRITDSNGLTYDETFTINLTDVNEAPPVINSNGGGATASITVSENTTTVTTVTATDSDTRQTLAYSIAGGADAAKFTINSSTGALSFVSAPNHETPTDSGGNNVYNVTVQVSDGNGGTTTQAIAVTVANVNEGPTDLALSANTVAENATTGTVVGTVSGTDPDAGDTKTYSLTDTAGGRFTINASTGVITVADGSLLNYEAAASHNLTVQITDSGGQSYTEQFTINLTNVNEGPTDLSLSANSVAENASTGTVVGTVTGTDPDAGDTKTYSLTDTAGGRFAINASTGVITVADGSLLNYESAASHNLTVQVTDSGGQSYTESFTINLTNVNEGPTDLSLSANSVAENATTGTVVGTVSGTDPDAGDTKTYSLADTAGGRFAINASTGVITVADGSLLNYEAAASHNLTVQVTDSGGLTYDETFTINLTNVNEGPTGADATITITEDTSQALTATNFGFSDVDAGDSLSAVRIDTLPSVGSLTLSGVAVTAGQVVTVADLTAGNLVFTPAANANGTGYASVTFSVRDSNNVYDAAPNTMTFNVTAVNDAPVLTPIAPNVTFVEGGFAQVIDATGTIVDVDSTNFDGGILTISISANGTADDRLMVGNWGTGPGQVGVSGSTVTYGGTVIGTVSGGTSGSDPLTVTFNTSATSAAVQEIYRSIQFTNESDNPSTATRTLAIGLTDGDGGTATPQTKLVFVQATNDAPSDLSLSANTVAENATTGTVVGTVSGTDPDASDTKSYSLTDTAGGRFAINSATGQLTVADGTLLNYEAATSHTVTVRVTDSGGQSYTEQFTINLTNVNEGPTGADAAVTISEDTAHALSTANLGFNDIDAGDSLSAVRIDTLPTAGTLTLSGVAVTAGQVVSVADITAGNLVFTPAANANGTGYASVTFSVRDSNNAYDTAPNTLTFNVTAVNDAPTDLALSANTVAENATTGTVVGTITGTDPDSGGSKTYSLTDTAGGRFAINASTGVITVADGNLLNYETAASHTLTVQVTDSGGQSYTETFTINLTNVNEGPIAATVADEFPEDMAYKLATVSLGIRDSNVSPNASLPGINLSNDSEEDRFRLPDNPRNVIEIKTGGPLPIEMLTPGHTGPSVVSAPVEKALATHDTERLPDLGEKREPNAMGDQTDIQNTAATEADRKEFLKPGDPIENVEESTALKLSATIGLAGIVLQNSLGNTTQLSRLISRPARASNFPPETTTQQSPVDDRASNQDKSEHPRSAAEDTDKADS